MLPTPKALQKSLIRHDTNLTDVAVSSKRTDGTTTPTHIYEIHIQNGIASTSIKPYPDTYQVGFFPAFTVGEAQSVSITFDGRWEVFNNKLRLQTDDKPYIFWVDNNGELFTQIWDLTNTKLSLHSATPVTTVKSIRAWKSLVEPQDDQGIIVGYIKNDGKVYYRSYAEDISNDFSWSTEFELTDFVGQAVNLNLFLTNDYRVGFMIEDDTGVKSWYISERNYTGTSVDDENIDIGLADYTLSLSPVMQMVIGDGEYPNTDPNYQGGTYEWEDENINTTITDYKMFVLFGGETSVESVQNVQSTVAQEEVEIGTGDGVTTVYETTWYPVVEDSETVKVNSVTKTKDVDYTIDYPTGAITFSSTPTAGHSIAIAHDWLSYGHMIKVTFDNGIQNGSGLQAQVTVVDTIPNNYVCSATELGADWDNPIPVARFDGSRELLLTVSNFNECVGDLTLDYTSIPSTLLGEAEQDVSSFQLIFTPSNLIAPRNNAVAPVVEVIFNE